MTTQDSTPKITGDEPSHYWILPASNPNERRKHRYEDCPGFAGSTKTPVARNPATVTDYRLCEHCRIRADGDERPQSAKPPHRLAEALDDPNSDIHREANALLDQRIAARTDGGIY